jgi:phage-related protein
MRVSLTKQSVWSVEFYTDIHGRSPVQEFINDLSAREQAAVYRTIRLLHEFGVHLPMPHAKPIERGLWELRVDHSRLFYFAHIGRRFIILHGYRKHSQKAPQREIETAERRRADFLESES